MVQKFLDALRNDPRAQELIKDMPVPKSDEEAVACYAKLAKDLGFDLTTDDIKSGLKAMENDRKAQSDKVSLDADDLENVAGGANEGCNDTHSDGEWCWFTDSCSYIITYYNMQPDGTPNTPPGQDYHMHGGGLQSADRRFHRVRIYRYSGYR